MSDTKIRSKPSHYPFFAFHFIRTCSLVCSTIVSAILLYFGYWLKHDNYKIPWTFLIVRPRLLACAAMSLTSHLAARSITAHPHHPRRHLSVPRLQQPVTKDQSPHQHSSPHPLDSRHGPPGLEH